MDIIRSRLAILESNYDLNEESKAQINEIVAKLQTIEPLTNILSKLDLKMDTGIQREVVLDKMRPLNAMVEQIGEISDTLHVIDAFNTMFKRIADHSSYSVDNQMVLLQRFNNLNRAFVRGVVKFIKLMELQMLYTYKQEEFLQDIKGYCEPAISPEPNS